MNDNRRLARRFGGQVPRIGRAVAAAAVLTLAACSSGSGGGGKSSGSPTPDPRNAAIVKAYESYWVALVKASDPPKSDSPALAQYATDIELRRAQAVVADHERAHEVVRGEYTHADSVAIIKDKEAHLTDCLRLHTVVFDAKTNGQKKVDPQGPFPVAVTLKLDGSQWQVAEIKSSSSSCTPTPLPTSSKSSGK